MTDLTKRPKHISDILIYRLANLSASKRSLPSAEVAAVICDLLLLQLVVDLSSLSPLPSNFVILSKRPFPDFFFQLLTLIR